MYTIYLRPLGEITLLVDTMYVDGPTLHISGFDEDHNRIEFNMGKVCFPDDQPYDCGYCYVKSYIKDNVVTQCNCYKSFSA